MQDYGRQIAGAHLLPPSPSANSQCNRVHHLNAFCFFSSLPLVCKYRFISTGWFACYWDTERQQQRSLQRKSCLLWCLTQAAKSFAPKRVQPDWGVVTWVYYRRLPWWHNLQCKRRLVLAHVGLTVASSYFHVRRNRSPHMHTEYTTDTSCAKQNYTGAWATYSACVAHLQNIARINNDTVQCTSSKILMRWPYSFFFIIILQEYGTTRRKSSSRRAIESARVFTQWNRKRKLQQTSALQTTPPTTPYFFLPLCPKDTVLYWKHRQKWS